MNLKIYNAVRKVPQEAMKSIGGGRLKGMTDINPMWRIKALTELFGPCGIGWYPEITKQWIEEGAKEEKTAHVNINLYVKHEGEWSKPIPGTGGSMFVEAESRGLHTSDECFKMAYTDAISVACKSLGVGADVYWDKDKTKYDRPQQPNAPQATQTPAKPQTLADVPSTPPKQENASTGATASPTIEEKHRKALYANYKSRGLSDSEVKGEIKNQFGKDSSTALTIAEFKKLMEWVETHPKMEDK